MSQSIFPGPIAPENNPPITPEYFQPSNFPITAITLGPTTVITTGTAFGVSMNYVIGQQVRLNIPSFYGARELNGKTALVISLPASNQCELSLNSVDSSPFIANPSYGPTQPQIIAIGDINTGIINAQSNDIVKPLLPGSFENISPGIFS